MAHWSMSEAGLGMETAALSSAQAVAVMLQSALAVLGQFCLRGLCSQAGSGRVSLQH